MRITNKLLSILIMLLIGFACNRNPNTPDYEKEIAVFGYLWGNKPMTARRAIMISYTQPIDQLYEFDKSAIEHANVTITEAKSGRIFVLNDAEKPGFYYNDSLIAQAKTEYVLKVEVDNKLVIAATTVPPELRINTPLSTNKVDSVYQAGLSIQRPIFINCEDGEQIIVVDAYCNESWENAEFINPFWGRDKPESVGDYGGTDGNSEPRHIVASIKYKNLSSLSHPGLHAVDWYSSMIVFFGSYTLQVTAIDDNYYNFININEYPELQSGIEGGIGVFGSVCGETFRLYILKP